MVQCRTNKEPMVLRKEETTYKVLAFFASSITRSITILTLRHFKITEVTFPHCGELGGSPGRTTTTINERELCPDRESTPTVLASRRSTHKRGLRGYRNTGDSYGRNANTPKRESRRRYLTLAPPTKSKILTDKQILSLEILEMILLFRRGHFKEKQTLIAAMMVKVFKRISRCTIQ